MLKVETRFMIKDLYRQGVTISDIARTTGHDRKTIRAVLKGPVSPPPQKRKGRAKKLDPFVLYLEKRMAEGVFNSKKLHNPGHADHRFRWMPSTHSRACRPVVPAHGVQFFQVAGIGGRHAPESGWMN